jgi:hypothetical protein
MKPVECIPTPPSSSAYTLFNDKSFDAVMKNSELCEPLVEENGICISSRKGAIFLHQDRVIGKETRQPDAQSRF